MDLIVVLARREGLQLGLEGLPLRRGTQQVLAILHRYEGASVFQAAEATGWQAHTVRGSFGGVTKRGIEVSVLERVRQAGPNKAGAKGRYTVYRVAETS